MSLLSCTSKFLETLIFGKLYDLIKDIIGPEQYGFRKNRSSITQIIVYMSEIFDHLLSTTLATMYQDFEKAFDKVSHGKLLEKLTKEGIRGTSRKLSEMDHLSQVNLLSEVESHKDLYLDLYFLSFLLTIFQNVSCQHALDMRMTIRLLQKYGITLQIDAHKIWKWCSSNLMSLNLEKCKVLCLKGIAKVSTQGHQLENSIVEKDLGIMISNDLTWTAQTERRCEKTMKAFFTIKRNIANGTPWTTRKNLYCNYIVPILSYGAVLWKPSKTDLKSIELIQRKASKWILGTSQLEYKERL